MSTTATPRRSGPPPELRRTTGDVFRGLGALVMLLALLAFPPVALAIFAGPPPIPESLPTLDAVRDLFTTRDDGTALVGFLIWVGWFAWATFAVSVLLEIPAAVRGRAAVRVPGLRLQQRAAAGLIGLIILAVTAGPVATAGVMTETVVVSAPADTSASAPSSFASPPTTTSTATDDDSYVVQPGDTLWEIAERELGSGQRWPEIAKLNYGQPQPNDPQGLRDPSSIDPGWQLAIPFDTADVGSDEDADAGHIVVEGDTLWDIAAASLGPGATNADIAAEWPRWYERNRDLIGDNPDLIQPGMQLVSPDAVVASQEKDDDAASDPRPSPKQEPAAEPDPEPEPDENIFDPMPEPLPEPEPDEAEEPAAEEEDSDSSLTVVDARADADATDMPDIPIRTIGGIGSLLAAGLVAVFAVQRRRRRSKRLAGESIAIDENLLRSEQALWDVADQFGVDAVDLGLRAIAASCARDGVRLPVVRAARLTADQFELYLDEPASLPAPWTQADDDYVWAIAPGASLDTSLSAAEVRDTPAPYPGLVTIGHDTENGHILLDLEYVGLLAVAGSELRVRHVLTALAIELATSSWADDATVAVVGICSELASSLGTGRLRYIEDVDSLLTLLESHASHDREVLSSSGAASAASARSSGAGEWYPEIALIATPLSAEESQRLESLLSAEPRLAMAAVVPGGASGGASDDATAQEELPDWTITLDPTDPAQAVLEPLGLAVAPQQVNATDYRAIVDMLAETHQPPSGSSPASGSSSGSDGLVAISDLADAVPDLDPRDGPVIRVLGPVHIDGARGTADASHKGQLTEIAAYIALYPGCSSDDLDHAIWPGEPLKGKTRAQACSRLRNWLGDSAAGERYFPQMSDGGYRFAPGVRTDWAEFQRLVGSASGFGGLSSVPSARLSAALELVRGQPFTGTSGRRPKYRWADRLRASMIETIADSACVVAAAALSDGSPVVARDAAVTGLQAEPGMEQLWRLLITAEHAAGNLAAVQAAVGDLYALFDDLGTEPELETSELISRLAPGTYRRASVT